MSKKEKEDKKKSSKKTNVKDSKDGLKDSKDPSAPSSPSLEKGASAGKGIYLALTVHSASDLFANDARGTSDPYVKIEVSGHSKKTKRINHTLNPVWEETFVIHFKADNWEGQQLSFNVYDHDRLSKDNSLGLTNHTLTRTPVDEIKVHINKLTGKKSKGSLVFVISLHSTNPDKVSIGAKHKAAAKGVGAQPPPASKEQVAESDSESSEDEGKKKVGFVDNPKVAPTTTTPRTEDSKPEVKQEEVISVEEEGDDFPFGRVTEEYEYILEDDDDEDDDLIRQQEEVMMLLLESRSILKQVVRWSWIKEQEIIKKKHEERDRQRKRRGQLSPTEIQNLLKVQQDDEDFDWISEIEELKRQLVQEIRRNHVLDKDLSRLDQRIGLLIANRGHLDALQVQEKSKRRRRRAAKKGGEEAHVPFDLSKDPKKLGHYQELFYLLQTEPRYLARSLYLVQAEQMDSFLDTTILTLYGDAFSPREEYLILQLFKLAIKNEISKIKSLADFLNATTVLPKMVITYNRRKQGLEYLKKTLGPVLKKVMEKRDLSLELQPMTIYFGMINDIETKTGEKSNLSRQITDAEAAQNPDVQQIIKRRMEALKEIASCS